MVRLPKRIRLAHETYADNEAVFHVVFRAAFGEVPFRTAQIRDAVWDLVINEHDRGNVRIYAACLMADHFHCLVSPRNRDIIKWVDGFKSFSTRVSQRHRPQRILWQPGFYDRRIRDEAEFAAAVEYIVRNPVDAGLVEDSIDWPWSAAWVDEVELSE
jgi:putative transposase